MSDNRGTNRDAACD